MDALCLPHCSNVSEKPVLQLPKDYVQRLLQHPPFFTLSLNCLQFYRTQRRKKEERRRKEREREKERLEPTSNWESMTRNKIGLPAWNVAQPRLLYIVRTGLRGLNATLASSIGFRGLA